MEIEIPKKGDLVYLNFNPQLGREQAGHRPAIVLSETLFNKGTFITVCPITEQEKKYPFEVKIPEGLKIKGVILTDQVKNLNWRARNLKIVDKAPEELTRLCLRYISRYLNFHFDNEM